MSHYSYTYQTLVALEIQHPSAISVKNNTTFVPSEATLQLIAMYQLIMKPTATGFVIAYRTSTTFDETKDTEGNITYTPNGTMDWLDITTLDITLEFFCIANKKFTKDTSWENLGPREKNDGEVTLIYTYNLYSALYDAPTSAPDIDQAPIPTNYTLENKDYNRLQVAQINFQLLGHIPGSTHKINTIII